MTAAPAPNPVREAARVLRFWADHGGCAVTAAAADALERMSADPDPATVGRCASALNAAMVERDGIGCLPFADLPQPLREMHEADARTVLVALGSPTP